MPHALRSLAAATALTIAISGGFPIVYGANAQVSSETDAPGYVTLARLADAAPQVLRVQVKKTTVVDPARAPDVAPGMARLFVEAQVLNLIRGKQGVSESIRYLVDVPRNAKGNVPKLKKQQFLLFARPGTRAGEIQLVSKEAQIVWSQATEQQVRTIVTELSARARRLRSRAFARRCMCAATCRVKARRSCFWRHRPATRYRSPCCAAPASLRAGRFR